ncbi:histidinol dehydrogenase [Bremerella cremea]|uniref:Histidinol dehydrogenase n=1 Tax=Bremerella cremea TaxID=1031537 RepID=A0A368KPI2_9BACT|nr:histidinol dehydrogenase [Bremerella cremea]RCS41420.1 histidinol dehydrogenase [Bremerella cremea]
MDLKSKIARIDTRQDDVESQLQSVRDKLSPKGNIVSEAGRQRTIAVFGEPLSPQQVVERICADVEARGLAAVLEYGQKLDGKQLYSSTIRVSEEELRLAHEAADPQFLATIREIRENILRFQKAILHQDVEVPIEHGGKLRQRYAPLKRVGICVPGGAAAYPSTVLMTAVPALAAGVEELVVIAPPTSFGSYNLDLLATCVEIGVKEVYRVGGAQGVAALAYGVEGIPKVQKIVGPGNLFVALAKKHVFGDVDIDSIAGPSEVVVVADSTATPQYIAADMLAQAEHSPGSSVLISWDEALIDAALTELEKQVAVLERCDLTVQSLIDFGAVILTRDEEEACRIATDLAPEHLHIATQDSEATAEKILTAGATFLGNFTPVAVGDYAAGPSHVLPTGATAHWASGLSANDFLRSRSVIHFTEDGLKAIAPLVTTLADKEGLTAHKRSVTIRTETENG